MKNTFSLAIALLLASAALKAQSTVDSIAAKYKLLPMPEALTLEKTFPIIGTYQLANAVDGQATVSIKIDSVNKGIVWIEGLPQGTIKAYLKKAPATYRILSQKTSTGKQIPEGTLLFNKETNTLNLEMGAAYNESDPASVFTTATVPATGAETKLKVKKGTEKSKTKIIFYTATKVDQTSTAGTPVNHQ